MSNLLFSVLECFYDGGDDGEDDDDDEEEEESNVMIISHDRFTNAINAVVSCQTGKPMPPFTSRSYFAVSYHPSSLNSIFSFPNT